MKVGNTLGPLRSQRRIDLSAPAEAQRPPSMQHTVHTGPWWPTITLLAGLSGALSTWDKATRHGDVMSKPCCKYMHREFLSAEGRRGDGRPVLPLPSTWRQTLDPEILEPSPINQRSHLPHLDQTIDASRYCVLTFRCHA